MTSSPTAVCPLCGAGLAPEAVRCPSCGLYLRAAQRNPFGQAAMWAMIGGLALVYAITLLVVAFTN